MAPPQGFTPLSLVTACGHRCPVRGLLMAPGWRGRIWSASLALRSSQGSARFRDLNLGLRAKKGPNQPSSCVCHGPCQVLRKTSQSAREQSWDGNRSEPRPDRSRQRCTRRFMQLGMLLCRRRPARLEALEAEDVPHERSVFTPHDSRQSSQPAFNALTTSCRTTLRRMRPGWTVDGGSFTLHYLFSLLIHDG